MGRAKMRTNDYGFHFGTGSKSLFNILPPPSGVQGIEAKILLAQPKDWSEKPGLRRFTPQMHPNSEL
jgi:hypothetical protein